MAKQPEQKPKDQAPQDQAPKVLHRRKGVPIEYLYPAHVEGKSGQLAVVQHDAERFILSFFEIFLPHLTQDVTPEQLKALPNVQAKCVARVHVTPSAIKVLRDTLSTNIATYEAQYGEISVPQDRIAKDVE